MFFASLILILLNKGEKSAVPFMLGQTALIRNVIAIAAFTNSMLNKR